jgi:hypothetical protein
MQYLRVQGEMGVKNNAFLISALEGRERSTSCFAYLPVGQRIQLYGRLVDPGALSDTGANKYIPKTLPGI